MPTLLLLGAGSDIAMAMAKKFAQQGYHIQLAARNPDKLAALAADIQIRWQTTCTTHLFDATNMQDHAAFVHNLPTLPDVAVVVFGVMYEEESAWENWDQAYQMIQTNFTGAVSIGNALAKAMLTRKSGCIVGISSVAGERGRQSKLIYGASKAGFTAYLSGLRNKLCKEGIHVSTIKPGFVYTRMTEELSLPPLLTAAPEQVAAAVWEAVRKKKNTVYVKWMWRYIMFIIRNIPEFVFKKMNL